MHGYVVSFKALQVMSSGLLLNVRQVLSERSHVLVAAQAAAHSLFSDELERRASSCCCRLVMMKVSVVVSASVCDTTSRKSIHLNHCSAAVKNHGRMVVFETDLVVRH